jgi:hypothetical protein
MPTLHVSVPTPLEPAQAIRRLTDFGPARADAFPNVSASGVTVHDHGPGWAEVTEGNWFAWERERYTWDADAGTVSASTLDSNLWATGSGWDYKITAQAGGSRVDVTTHRIGKGIRGRIVAALLTVAGKSFIRSSTAKALSYPS